MSIIKIAVAINSIAIVALGVGLFMNSNNDAAPNAEVTNSNAADEQMIKSYNNKIVSDTHIVKSDTFPMGFDTIFNIKTNEIYTLYNFPSCNKNVNSGSCCTISKGATIYHPRFNEPVREGSKSMFTVRNNDANIPNACPESFMVEVNTALFDKNLEIDMKAR